MKLSLGTELEVSAHTPDVGEGQELLDAEYEGEPFVIAFNPQFLYDGGSAVQSERLVLEAGDGLKPAILQRRQRAGVHVPADARPTLELENCGARVGRLVLEDFRNYESLAVELADGLNLVVGRNAQGKTNLLEAVYCLSGLGSPALAGRDVDQARPGTSASARRVVTRRERTIEVDIELKPGRGHRALINKTADPIQPRARGVERQRLLRSRRVVVGEGVARRPAPVPRRSHREAAAVAAGSPRASGRGC